MAIVFGRSFYTAIILAAVIFLKDKKLFKVNFKDLPLFIGAGVFSIILFNFSYYKTMSLTSLSVAAVLLYTAPFFVVIISAFLFKERLNFKKNIRLYSSFFGLLIRFGNIWFAKQNNLSGNCFRLAYGIWLRALYNFQPYTYR